MPDNEGWIIVRDWDNDRIIEGIITKEVRDLQGDIVPVDLIVSQMDWLGKNGVLIYEHANDPKRGVVPLGRLLAWKRVDDEIHTRWGIHKGSRIIDDIWVNEMKPLGTRAGFSIGGAIFNRTCRMDANGQRTCAIQDLEVIEVSWTPRPANQYSYCDYINELAKQVERMAMDAFTKSEKAKDENPNTSGGSGGGGAAAGAILQVLPELLALEDDYQKDLLSQVIMPEKDMEGIANGPDASTGAPSSKAHTDGFENDTDLKKPDAAGNFTPPPSGSGYSEHQKKILREAYSSCRREQGGSEKPSDKAKCARIAWGAVHNAAKDADAGGEAVDKKPEDLETRVRNIYKGFYLKQGEELDGASLVRACGTCDDYATSLVKMGKSVAQALLMTENLVRKAMAPNSPTTINQETQNITIAEKASGDVAMSPPPAASHPSAAPAEPQKPVNEIEDLKKRIAQLEAAFAKWMQQEQTEPAHQAPAGIPGKEASSEFVGTGTPPLKGIQTEAPEEIDRKKMKTTKEMSDGEMIEALAKKGFTVMGIKKGTPDTVPGSDPTGSQKIQKSQEKNDPLEAFWKKEVV